MKPSNTLVKIDYWQFGKLWIFKKHEPPCIQASNAVINIVDSIILSTSDIGIPVISRDVGSCKIIDVYPADKYFQKKFKFTPRFLNNLFI